MIPLPTAEGSAGEGNRPAQGERRLRGAFAVAVPVGAATGHLAPAKFRILYKRHVPNGQPR